jgi:hypothetical protein
MSRRLLFTLSLQWVGLSALLVGCEDSTTTTSKPPVAGMLLPLVASVGQSVRLDASPTAIAGVAVDRFVWTVADGSPAVELADAVTTHVFATAGSYGVRLEVIDRKGQRSTADGRIEVVDGFSAFCSATDSSACALALCDSGSCVDLACAATPACPEALAGAGAACVAGKCVRAGGL